MNFKDSERQFAVLLVDDDQVLLKVERECLVLQGSLDVEIASSRDDAFKKMEKVKPDVIVYNFQMRRENPFIFLKELRDKGDTTPFIGLIEDDEKDLALRACHLGANAFVKKFEDPSILYPQLKRLIMSLVKP